MSDKVKTGRSDSKRNTSGKRPDSMQQSTFSRPNKFTERPHSFRDSFHLAAWFFRMHPLRGSLVVLSLILAGIFEGIGIASLFPLFSLVFKDDARGETRISEYVDSVVNEIGLEPTLPVLLTIIVVFITAKSLLLLLAVSQAGYSAAHITKVIRLQLLRRLADAEWKFFTGARMGNITAALTSEADKASGAYLQIVRMLASIFHIIVYLTLALVVSPWITLASAVVGLFTVLLLSRLVKIARSAGQSRNLIVRGFLSRLIDGLSAFKPIKAMGQERQLIPLLESDVSALNEVQRKVIISKEALKTLYEPIIIAVIAVAIYVTFDSWQGKTEALFAMILLFYRTVGKFNAIQASYQGLVRNEAGFSFVKTMISQSAAAGESNKGGRKPRFEKELRFNKVSFSYDGTPVLRDASFVIPAYDFVALTGPSGAGKTTCADLIIGLVRPDAGEILVDDVPLSELKTNSWRKMIGYVPQETVLFHDTIHANVSLGDDTISRRRVERALERANALEFVMATPNGLNTVVGQHGLKISGGQRQRIAIARALVRDPKLLILDEATTALDPENEALVCKTIAGLAGDITILAISHQRALVDAATTVYRIEDLKVVGATGSSGQTAQAAVEAL